MATYYCTSDDVARHLQRNDYTESSTPSQTYVEDIINMNEDYIDNETGHAWRVASVSEEYIDPTDRIPGAGVRFDLMHRNLRTLTSGTDKIEVWDGSSWIDYVATKTAGTGPNSGDYFVDYTNGVVFIRSQTRFYPSGVRFTYRYGDSIVAKDIKMACVLLTAADILENDQQTLSFSDDGSTNRPNFVTRVEQMRSRADDILNSHKEFIIL